MTSFRCCWSGLYLSQWWITFAGARKIHGHAVDGRVQSGFERTEQGEEPVLHCALVDTWLWFAGTSRCAGGLRLHQCRLRRLVHSTKPVHCHADTTRQHCRRLLGDDMQPTCQVCCQFHGFLKSLKHEWFYFEARATVPSQTSDVPPNVTWNTVWRTQSIGI